MKTDLSTSPVQRGHSRVKRPIGAARPLRLWLGALAACAFWIGASLTQASTFTVTSNADTGAGSLRDAIALANANPGADTIAFNLPLPNTIVLGSQLPTITDNLTITGPGTDQLAINGGGAGRVFLVTNSVVSISSLTITNGAGGHGGGIFNAGTLTVSNCTVSGNAGGEVNYGGGLFNAELATLTVNNCTVSGNHAGYGGGIASQGVLYVNNSTVSGNSATFGGALINLGTEDNSVPTMTIINCTVSGNSGEYSAGINNDGDGTHFTILRVINSTISGNSSSFIGGGIESGSELILNNSIVAGNTAAGFGPDIFSEGTLISNGHNFIGNTLGIESGLQPTDKTFASTETTLGNLLQTSAGVPVLADNGGPTKTIALVANSPAIDGGANADAVDQDTNSLATDQRGFVRIINGTVDIGAFEYNSRVQQICPPLTLTVTTMTDSGPGSLRQAILDANACQDTNTIVFAPSAYGTITLTSGELLITNSVNIFGPGPVKLAVDGNWPSTTNRVFEIGPGIEVTIAGISITKGSADDATVWTGLIGGGILNVDSSLIVSNCSVVGNSVGRNGGGGGICSVAQNSTAALCVVNSTISSNSMGVLGQGGGIASVPLGNATVAILNSSVSHNVGDVESSGLGIANVGPGNMWMQIVNSTLSGNSTPVSGTGGGVVNVASGGTSLIQIMNSTLSDNAVGSDGVGDSIANIAFDGTATVQVVSTVLKAGASGANLANIDGGGHQSITSLGFNLSSDDGGGYLDQSSDLLNKDPMLGPLQDNGGPTLTHALQRGSPAIDAGTNLALLATDQRGEGFVRVFGASTDIGAFELQKVPNQSPVALCRNVIVSADSGCQANASIDAGSYDPDPGDTVTLSQSPAGPYSLGMTTVKLTVTDNHGSSSSCTALVTVLDTTRPTVACPGNQIVNATTPSGTVVNYPAATASDNCGLASTSYSKAAGTVFPIGTTTVTFTPRDNSGNSNTCSFTVKVKSASEQITDLIALVNGLPGVKAATKNALVVKLNAAQMALLSGATSTACSTLKDFISLAMAQAAKKELTSAQANLLINQATRIRAVLACS